jgi:hypothetical protein
MVIQVFTCLFALAIVTTVTIPVAAAEKESVEEQVFIICNTGRDMQNPDPASAAFAIDLHPIDAMFK